MSPATPEQLDLARRLLAHEAAAHGEQAGSPTAAGRVYDVLFAHLSQLVGAAGVQQLLIRSAKLTQGDFASIATGSILESAARLRERLQDPAVSRDSAALLFATFVSLITTFIGDRLTTQILRVAWPTLELNRALETKK